MRSQMVLQMGSVANWRADTEHGKYINQGELKQREGQKAVSEDGVLRGSFPGRLA